MPENDVQTRPAADAPDSSPVGSPARSFDGDLELEKVTVVANDSDAPHLHTAAPLHLDDEGDAVNPAVDVAKLEVISGNDFGRSYTLDRARLTIGRGVDNDIVLSDISVSRHHLRLEGQTGDFFAVDIGSGNGTLVNGEEIRGRIALRNHDTVEIGNTVLRLLDPLSWKRPRVDALSPPLLDDLSINEERTVEGKGLSARNLAAESVSPRAPRAEPFLVKPVLARPDSENEPTHFAGPPQKPVVSDYDNPAPTFLPSATSHWDRQAAAEPAPARSSTAPSIPSELLKVTKRGAPSGRLPPSKAPESSLVHPVPYPKVGAGIQANSQIPPRVPIQSASPFGATIPAEAPLAHYPAEAAPRPYNPGYAPLPHPAQVKYGANHGAKPRANSSNLGRMLLLLASGGLLLACIGLALAYVFSNRNRQAASVTEPEEPSAQEALPPKVVVKSDPKAGDQKIAKTPKVKQVGSPPRERSPSRPVKTAKPRERRREIERPTPRRPEREELPTKSSKNAEARARSLYVSGDFSKASSVLRDAADETNDDDLADELLDIAAGFSKIGNLMKAADATSDANPSASLRAFKKALIQDKKVGAGAHEDEISKKIASVAPVAARAFMAKKAYEDAREAAEDAERFGAGDDVDNVLRSLERKAEQKLKDAEDAEDDGDDKAAQKLYKEISRFAPKSSSAYSDALKALKRL